LRTHEDYGSQRRSKPDGAADRGRVLRAENVSWSCHRQPPDYVGASWASPTTISASCPLLHGPRMPNCALSRADRWNALALLPPQPAFQLPTEATNSSSRTRPSTPFTSPCPTACTPNGP